MGFRKFGTAPDQHVPPEEGDGPRQPEYASDETVEHTREAIRPAYGPPHPRADGDHPNDY